MRKFTRVFRAVYEREIARELDQGAKPLLNKQGSDMKKSLDEELKEGETLLTKRMKEEKQEFIKKFQKHQIKSKDEDFQAALAGKDKVNVISVVKHKRDNEDDVEELAQKEGKKSKNKRHKHD